MLMFLKYNQEVASRGLGKSKKTNLEKEEAEKKEEKEEKEEKKKYNPTQKFGINALKYYFPNSVNITYNEDLEKVSLVDPILLESKNKFLGINN